MMKKIHRPCWLLATLICLLLTLCGGTAWAFDVDELNDGPPALRVMISSSAGSSSFSFSVSEGAYYLVQANELNGALYFDQDMDYAEEYGPGDSFSLQAGSGWVAVPEDEDCTCSYGSYDYRGAFLAVVGEKYNYAINLIDVELYLYGVVGNEIGDWNLGSIEAQAVAARSYAIGSISDSNKYYDVSSTTSSQVYHGYSSESKNTRKAVDNTRGWLLSYDDKVVLAYYSSSSGGHTENIENIWVSDEVPLPGVASDYDRIAGTNSKYGSYAASCWSWTVEYSPAQLVSMANRYGDTNIGEYRSISLSTTYQGQTSVSGRAMQVTIKGSKGSVTAAKDNIRSLLNLKSTMIDIIDNSSTPTSAYARGLNRLFDLESLSGVYALSSRGVEQIPASLEQIYVRSADGLSTLKVAGGNKSSNIVIQGYGYGHGVGMSQWGAIAMADDGWEWDEIIEHYYCQGGVALEQYYD